MYSDMYFTWTSHCDIWPHFLLCDSLDNRWSNVAFFELRHIRWSLNHHMHKMNVMMNVINSSPTAEWY